MTIRITFDLSEADLGHFKSVMDQARSTYKDLSEEQILERAGSLLSKVEGVDVPEFVTQRLSSLERLIDMVNDSAWALGEPERGRVLAALAYFADPEDMIHDSIPGIGYLDDAIMIELICRELKHEIQAYDDFCKYRESEAERRGMDPEQLSREGWLETRRKELHSRMRHRRRSARSRRGGRSSSSRGFSLW